MGNAKKVAIAVALLAVIVVAVIMIVKKAIGKATPPDWALQERMEKIDEKSLELVTLPFGEWTSLGEKGGKFKNPKTGSYTMVTPIICFSCGATIPPPDYSSVLASDKSDPRKQVSLGDIHKVSAAYMCPKCGKPAFDAQGRSGMPKGAGGAGK